MLRRLDRHTPEWMKWLTPWGTSLALHSLLLLGLALLVLARSVGSSRRDVEIGFRFADQLREDLTALERADRSGDPFNDMDPAEPPSLTFEPSRDPDAVTNVPELPASARLGEGLSLDAPVASSASAPNANGPHFAATPELAAPFSGRQAAARARLVRREGGSVESERAVELGLDWIARHQRSDGSWSLDHRPQCRGRPCPEGPHADSDSAATGLALLPLLGAGLTHDHASRYQKPIARGIDWLLKEQKPYGDLFTGGGNTYMYSHAIAAMALCEAYGITRDQRLAAPAQKAVDFIISAQSRNDGGWRYNPGESGDTSVVGWQMFALRSAHLAGLRVDGEAIKRCTNYLDSAATNATRTKYAYQPHGPATPVMTAEALLVRQYLGWTRENPGMRFGTELVADHLMKSKERNIYYWYYATQLLHNMQGPDWKRWNPRVRDGLVRLQVVGDGCDRGSWDPERPLADRWGHDAGRHFLTSLSLLTLEVYYRYLPLYRSRDKELVDPGERLP
jgi:hypothetical protein